MTVLFFTANWCGVCKAMYPIWNEIVPKATAFNFELVDCSEDTTKAVEYQVSTLPCFVVVDDIGTPIDRRQGFLSEMAFEKWLYSLK